MVFIIELYLALPVLFMSFLFWCVCVCWFSPHPHIHTRINGCEAPVYTLITEDVYMNAIVRGLNKGSKAGRDFFSVKCHVNLTIFYFLSTFLNSLSYLVSFIMRLLSLSLIFTVTQAENISRAMHLP